MHNTYISSASMLNTAMRDITNDPNTMDPKWFISLWVANCVGLISTVILEVPYLIYHSDTAPLMMNSPQPIKND